MSGNKIRTKQAYFWESWNNKVARKNIEKSNSIDIKNAYRKKYDVDKNIFLQHHIFAASAAFPKSGWLLP